MKGASAMSLIRRILLPCDFSEFSRRALDHALTLAEWYKAEITAIHVLPPTLTSADSFPHPMHVPALREQVLTELRQFVKPAEAAGISVRTAILEGDAVAQILEAARQLPADLVIMGTHGRGGFSRWVLGSVAEKVLRTSACPVLTVPPSAEGPVLPSALKRVLCPMDFSGSSMNALQHALWIVGHAEGYLTTLHVIEGYPEPLDLVGINFNVAELMRHLEQHARERLRQAVPEEARGWCKLEEIVTAGKPWREILRIAQEQATELIVIGVHGRNPVHVMLFGSTTHHVVRESICPVLTIRAEANEGA
jgi:nucleotide-binding universal stress UspA family protein